jgi:hypothetical protein
MTPRTSVRADARERFHELALSEANPPLAPEPPDLMARVRRLYEESAVPVREIARLARVTERTIYKYAQKHAWAPRYLWQDDHSCMLGRGWRAADDLAPSKGAGGRFIRRADAGKPFARGLQAVDPVARAKAAQSCAEADRLAREAWERAEHARLVRLNWSSLRAMDRAMDEIIRYRAKYPPKRRDPACERLLLQAWQSAVDALRCARLAVEQFEAGMSKPRI